MISLSNQQKELLFDYCIGLASEEEVSQAKILISSSKEAAETYAKLQAVFAPLDTLEMESCPADLVESTVNRLNNAARSSQLRLEQLLAAEQRQKVTTQSWFWQNISRRLATAAVFMVTGGILLTTFNIISSYARQNCRQQQCQMQLGRIAQGMDNYVADHDGQMPAVASATGSPWWKVGYAGNENHSNTRPIWLLVKNNYVNPSDFVCAGIKDSRAPQFDTLQVKNYNDFPSRKYITYSFRIRCSSSPVMNTGRKVLMADLNPLFEKLPQDFYSPFRLQLDKNLSTINSINHNRRGQNVLFCDGSAKFIKNRYTDISKDDIFTLQNTNTYEGCEVPTCEADAFLAP